MTRQYKVVYAPNDAPWFFDLERDPDELINYYGDRAYSGVIRHLAESLLVYGQDYRDDRVNVPAIQAALRAAVNVR